MACSWRCRPTDIEILDRGVSRNHLCSRSDVRPAVLDKLFAPVNALPGIGPALARLFERLAGPLVVDLVWHLPTGVVDRRNAPSVRDLAEGAVATVQVKVEGHEPGRGRRPYRVWCADPTG